VSADRVKPAYILHENNRGNNTNPPARHHRRSTAFLYKNNTTVLYKNNAFRSSIPFPLSLQHLSNHLRGGMMWEPATVPADGPNSFGAIAKWTGQLLLCQCQADKLTPNRQVKVKAVDPEKGF
jgi:hypothetical protein